MIRDYDAISTLRIVGEGFFKKNSHLVISSQTYGCTVVHDAVVYDR